MSHSRTPRTHRAPAALVLVLALAAGAAGAQTLPGLATDRRLAPTVGHPLLPGIWRLDGFDPALPAADLEPLRGIVGKATVVGLGESVHTSGGYHQMKDRTVRFLVQGLGFRAVAFESPWIAADRVAAYVQSCGEAPEDALKGLSGIWQSAEIRDLVEWMCDWNRSHRKPQDKLSFIGFDIQQPQADTPALTAFLARTGVPADSPWIDALSACAKITALGTDEESYGRCTGGLGQIDAYFRQSAARITRQTSKAAFTVAKLSLASLRAWEDEIYFLDRDPARSDDARDAGMAATFTTLRSLRFPRAKTVVWSHNFHVAKGVVDDAHTLGNQLARSLRKSYVSLALAAHEADIDWPVFGCGPSTPPQPDSVEERLHTLGEDTLLVDLAFPGTHDPFLPPGIRWIGGYEFDPRQSFNGVLYLDVSPKMTPLAWPPCH